MFVTYGSEGKPSSFPLSTSYLLGYLRAPAEDEVVVKRLIARAVAAFYRFTNGHCAALTQFDVWFDEKDIPSSGVLKLPVFPLAEEVGSITVFDTDGVETAAEVSSILGDKIVVLGDISIGLRETRCAKLTVRVGYSDTNIPDDILLGIEQFVMHAYANRGDTGEDIPDTVARLWAPYVRHRLTGA